MLYGRDRDLVDLTFSIPSDCARQLEAGKVEIGLVPAAEIYRQRLEIVPGVCIGCRGPVRSILLFSRVPWPMVRTLAADLSSRTSVQLARVILRERYGVEPQISEQRPVLEDMLARADAALIIGDPALRLDPNSLPYECLDLGSEWELLTGLPMVFAAWAGKSPHPTLPDLTTRSYEFGAANLAEIVASEYTKRRIERELADEYLRRYIRFELGSREMDGLHAFAQLAGLTKEQDAYATTGD